MKFRCVDEFEQLSFDDSPIVSFQMSTDEVTFSFFWGDYKSRKFAEWQISGYVLWRNNAYAFAGADETSCKRGHEIL